MQKYNKKQSGESFFAFGVVIFLIVVGLCFFIFGSGYFGLAYKETFDQKYADVDRKTYENTQSYVHGKTQDLAKYYEEYQSSDDKEAIGALIKMNFADFDEKDIRNEKLREFLVDIRGY